MGEPSDHGSASRRWRALAIVAVTLAVVVTVSTVAVVVSRQITDYHDAKYRAQYVIVGSFWPIVGEASRQALLLINENATIDLKYQAADRARENFGFLYVSAEELRVMYLDDDEKSGPLLDFREAFAAFGDAMSASIAQLMGPDYTWKGELTAPLISALNSSIPMLDDLVTIIERSIDAGRSPMEHPYSLIDKMDLAALQQTSRAIAENLSDWRPATVMSANLL